MTQGRAPSGGFRGKSVLRLFQLLLVAGFLGLWPHRTDVCLRLSIGLRKHGRVCSLGSFIRILVSGFRANLGNLDGSHLKTHKLNYI